MKTAKSYLIASFVFLLFTLIFIQSCSDNSIPVNQTVSNSQKGDRLCQTCWLIIYAYYENLPLRNAKVEVSFEGNTYLQGETDWYGYCSFYTEDLGLPGSPPQWLAYVENNYQISGGEWFSWDGSSYKYVAVECFAWE